MANPKLSEDVKEKVRVAIREGLSARQIIKKLGVSAGTISNVRQGNLNMEVEMQRAKQKEVIATRKYRDALKEIQRLQADLETFAPLSDMIRQHRPVNIKAKSGGRGEAVAVINAGDWHFEERVDSAAVNGVNEYNLDIARERAHRFWASAASLVDMCRSRSRIDTLVVNILGDLMNGWIHEPYVATNELTPTEAVLEVFTQLISGLDFLQKETKAKEIIVPCICGNHGRFTKLKWSKLGPGTSYEGLLYNLIARWHKAKRNKVIRFILPQGDMTYITVYDRVIRVTHGDNIQYAGGIGGVHVPLRKAIDIWNTQIRADYNYVGHWHSDMAGEDYRISGSLVGYNEFSIKIKARFRPASQAFELQHPKYGATARFPIIVQ